MNKVPEVLANTAKASGIFFMPENTCQADECKLIQEVMLDQIKELRIKVSDFEQRFDTLQTPFWKRVIFWIDGWPWHDLNGTQNKRPWHRGDK